VEINQVDCMRVSQKVREFPKEHIYCKYMETKLISLFNIIPIDFDAADPAFHKFFFKFRQKNKSFLVASLTGFAPRQ
jgi:c-di-GMP-related signal transduction protein